MNFEKPSKIQAVSLPMILTPPCKDLIAQAHNGFGKPLALHLECCLVSIPIIKLLKPFAFVPQENWLFRIWSSFRKWKRVLGLLHSVRSQWIVLIILRLINGHLLLIK